MDFSKILSQLIKNKNLNSKEIANNLELDEKLLLSWVSGVSEPSVRQLKKIAGYFKVSTDFLLGLEKKQNNSFPSAASPASFLDFVGQEEKDVDEDLMDELIKLNKAIDLKRKR